MASFSTLIAGKTTAGSIKNWCNRDDIPATEILTEAQALIYLKLRVREMMVRDDFASALGDTSESLPSDFLDMHSLTPYGWGEPLEYLGEHLFQQNMDEDGVVLDGTPVAYTIIGPELIWDSKLTEAFGGKIIYYKRPLALSAGTLTNFLTERYPTLLRHACLTFAYEHMKDEARSLDYRKKAEMEAQEASRQDDLFRRGQR